MNYLLNNPAFRSLVSLILVLFVLLVATPLVLAQRAANDPLSYPFYDPESGDSNSCSGSTTSSTASKLSGGSVFMVGDSVTAGAEKSLEEAMQEQNFTPVINALASRRLSTGSDPLDGLSVIMNSTAEIGSASAVVVALGTNGGVSTTNIQSVVDAVGDTPLFWVNVGVNNDKRSSPIDTVSINSTISDASQSGTLFTVINWASVVASNPDFITDDGIGAHLTSDGIASFSQTVVSALTGSGASNTGACRKLPGNNTVEQAYNYFIGRGLTPVQAAGIVGNINSESVGVRPTALQCIYSRENRSGADISLLDDVGGVVLANIDTAMSQLMSRNAGCGVSNTRSFGWGIVQWTPFSKMVDPSRAAGKSDSEIESLAYQLDFLWEQITGEDMGLGFKVPGDGQAQAGIDTFRRTTTVEDAAIWFAQEFERCANCDSLSHIQPRVDFARNLLNQVGAL